MVGRLVNPVKREAARQERSRQNVVIVAAAREVFLRDSYERATLVAIAGRAGVPEGTVAMLAGSREELFLTVTATALTSWCRATAADLESHSTQLDSQALAAFLARAVAADPALPRLLGLLPAAIETLVDTTPAVLLATRLRGELERLEAAIAARCPALAPGRRRSLPFYLLVLVAGLSPFARPVAGMGAVLADLELAQFGVDLETELRGLLAAHLS